MAEKKTITTVHGKHHTYEVVEEPGGVFGSPKYYVRRDDGKSWGSYSSRASAVRAAHEQAGSGAYESPG